MGKFDGILICSDFDGTLYTGGEVPKRSVEAIKYFQSEGGLFTICSGRDSAFLKEKSHFVEPNTYALCYNGAIICDLKTDEIIRKEFVTDEALYATRALTECGAEIKTINVCVESEDNSLRLHYSAEEFIADFDNLLKMNIFKITINGASEEDALLMMRSFNALGSKSHSIARSFISYPEIMHNDNMKGSAARRLKELTGARLLVGVGDYENDLDLIEKADIGYAVGNAVESVKAVADRVTVRVDECAIAKIIEELEAEYAIFE